MKEIVISIIIATFNSQKTLPLVLESIQKQTYSQEKIEVLIVDGGSTDNTLNIAKKFRSTVIKNPRTEPIYAKYLGYTQAKGQYLMYLDHDEVIENKDSLKIKLEPFLNEKDIKIVIGGGYKSPPHYPFINNYINEFGDPFSYFIYGLSKDSRFFVQTMKKRYPVARETNNYVIFDFTAIKSQPILELAAGASIFDRLTLKKEFPKTLEKAELLPHYFYLLSKNHPYFAITKNDFLIHYSSDVFIKYLQKIKWRIKNNIFHTESMGMSGFTGRDKFQPKLLQYKKYLFIPYTYSLILPLLDSVWLILTRRNLHYITHLPLCLYTASMILYYYLLKLLGTKPILRSYDETTEVFTGTIPPKA